MKVLIINTLGLRTGGITIHMINYLRYLMPASIDIVSTMAFDKNIIDRFEKIGCKIFYLPSRKATPLSYLLKLSALMKYGRYDVIHVHGNSATMTLELLCAFKAGTKIRIAHCHNTKCSHLVLNKILLPVFNRLYTQGVACSNKAGEWLFGNNNFKILHNAIDLENYKFSESIRCQYRKELHISENTLVIGHVGSFIEQKNHEFLIDVFYKVQEKSSAILLLVGVGELQQKIREKVMELGIDKHVLFLNLRDDVGNLLQAMDVFLFPSIWEGLPLVLIEVQAVGVPCVVSSKISEEVKVTDLLSFLKLENNAELWAEKIWAIHKFKQYGNSETAITQIRDNGYDILCEVDNLKNLYRAY